jgi:uncharacterized tellurite resistance protein B-like protein
MFGKLKDFFQSGDLKAKDVDSRDLQIATALLLLEMSGQDGDYAPEEVDAMIKSMKNEFNMNQAQALEIMEAADSLRNQTEKIDDFVKVINENFKPKQRQTVLTMVWRVILADGIIDKFETRFATQLKFRLQLTDAQAEQAKATAVAESEANA